MQSPHDALFKATFSELAHARPMLKQVLPKGLAAAARWSTLKLVPGSFVDEQLQDRHSDLLFTVRLRSRPALIHLLFEHQSSVDRWMPLRLLEYMVRIWRAHLAQNARARTLPPIIPIVLHHSDQGWTATTAFEDLFEIEPALREVLSGHIPRFRFLLEDLSRTSDEELRRRAHGAAKLVLACLRHARNISEVVEKPEDWDRVVEEIAAAPHGVHALRAALRYMFEVSNSIEVRHIQRFFERARHTAVQEEIVTLAEQLIEQGHLAGLEKGRAEGARKALVAVLREKFGKVPSRVLAQVKAADEATLDRWIVRAVTATSITEVIAR